MKKKAQKMDRKKSISDTINNITPILIPFCTANVWCPWYVPSVITSLNHKVIEYATKNKDVKNIVLILLNICILNAAEVVSDNRLIVVKIGQGDGETKWKGCPW